MEYVTLGNSGLKVSRIGLGLMTLKTVDQTIELLETARNYGCNFFDNAEAYGAPRGEAESLFGSAYNILKKKDPFKWRRSDLVITTKLYFGANGKIGKNILDRSIYGENEQGLSRKHLNEGMDNALQRTGLKYFDIVYAHRYDEITPMIEIVRTFTQLINDKKVFYWGTSMWPPHRIIEAYWIASKYDLIPPIVEQCKHSMMTRQYVEDLYLPVFDNRYNIATTIWGALDSGILTGKYLNDQIPDNSRLHKSDRMSLWYDKIPQSKHDKIAKLKDFAENELNTTVANLSLAWCMKNDNVTVVIVGAKRAQQLNVFESVSIVDKLDDDKMDQIEKILNNRPIIDGSVYGVNKIFSRFKRNFRPKSKL